MNWFTAHRLRAHAILLSICLWSVYAADLATPGVRDRNGLIKGTDFLHFYTLGRLALSGRGDLLYDLNAQHLLMRRLVPDSDIEFASVYGPQVSLLFVPFAALPYLWALAAWSLINILIYLGCCYAVWRVCPALQCHGITVLLIAVAFPGFFYLLAFGQTSGLALLSFTVAFLALRRDYFVLAGLALGSLAFKPQLGVASALVLVLSREWKTLAAALASAILQLCLGWWRYGSTIMKAYFLWLSHAQSHLALLNPHPYQSFSLWGFWMLLVPKWPTIAFALYVCCAIPVIISSVILWQRKTPVETRVSGLLLSTILVAPHLNVYDLVILAPAFLMLADWAVRNKGAHSSRTLALLLYCCYVFFLLDDIARITHIQLGVGAVAALFWICSRMIETHSQISANATA